MLSWLKISIIIGMLTVLSGCQWFTDSAAWKKPLPFYLVARIKLGGFELGAEIMARLFKQENRFEVWMMKDGRFQFFKSYGICSWSGELGPKLKEGDRQAPEGYYVVTPAQMNPRSKYYLSFNLGFPNFYDRSLGRTGSQLMVHGECSSRGCYALTNSSIEEVYLLARDAFKGGQRRFHVQAFPFQMTEWNLNKYKDHKWIDFWQNLAEGDKIFKDTGLPPRMSVANKRYVFSAASPRVKKEKQIISPYDPTVRDAKKAFTAPPKPPADKWEYFSNLPVEEMITDTEEAKPLVTPIKTINTKANKADAEVVLLDDGKLDQLELEAAGGE